MKTSSQVRYLSVILVGILHGGCKSPLVDVSYLWSFVDSALDLSSQEGERSVARIGGATISNVDIQETLRNYPASYRLALSSPAFQQSFITDLINQKVAYSLALRRGLYREPDFMRNLNTQKESLLINRYYDQARQELKLSDEYILKQYPLIAGPQKEIALSRITTPSLAVIQKAQTLLKAGKSFSSVARMLSTDRTTAVKGGSLGYLKPGEIEPRLRPLLSKLKDSEVTPIVQTSRGYELWRRESSRPYTPTPQDLGNWRRIVETSQIQGVMDEAKKNMTIEIDEEALAAAIQAAAKL